jgi:exodeoxyribonuclease-5
MLETPELSADQRTALDSILEWRERAPHGDKQYLTLGGYAGTGKTTLIARLNQLWEDVATVAFCGKAAHVLRSKGVVDAQTAHSLLYVPAPCLGGGVRFRKRRSLPGMQTIIVDEASMIDHVLFADLTSFGLPVLFVGDHGQLEPVGTNPRLMVNPDVRLEQIHRQAQGNPIVRLATAFREGRDVRPWEDPKGRLRVLGRSDFHRLVSSQVQIIVGFNPTRHRVNKQVRRMLGVDRHLVAPGEKLICLRNNPAFGIFNGQQLTVLDIAHEGYKTITLDVETDDGRSFALPCLRRQFGNPRVPDFWSQEVALLDYGYCLTAHKAQGSEWAEVLVREELDTRWDARRWRYTVTTRAKERLAYCA